MTGSSPQDPSRVDPSRTPPATSGYPSGPGWGPTPAAGYGPPPGDYASYPRGGYAPPADGFSDGPQTPPVRPGTVSLAFVVYLVGAALFALVVVLLLVNPGWDRVLADAARDSDLTADRARALVTWVKALLGVIAAVLLAVHLLFAVKMHAGRNWARITLTVLSALAVLANLGNRTTTYTVDDLTIRDVTPASWLNVLTAVALLVTIVLMYLPPSNEFFRLSKRHRAMLLLRAR